MGSVRVLVGLGVLFSCRLAVAQSPARPPVTAPSDYRVAAGDVLQVFVWKEPELTREATVRQDGKMSVPLLGDILAANRTPEQLAIDVTAGLERYLTAPQVTVAVKEANAARFFVIGQVARPGAFPLLGRTTLLQALALGGGLLEFAKADRIVIVRDEQGIQTFVTLNYKKLEAGSDITQNAVLHPGDTIVVP